MSGPPPSGPRVRSLHPHHDERGTFLELFRDEWGVRRPPGRWSLEHVSGERPLEVDDELVVALDGRARLAVDGAEVTLDASEPALVCVEPGQRARLHALDAPALVARAGDGAPAASPRPVVGATRPELPEGVAVFDLPRGAMERELLGPGWDLGVRPVQWNAVRSRAGVLRGVHCHPRHADLLCVAGGRMQLGLADLRDGGVGAVTCLDLRASRPQLVSIPPGVAHGFLFLEPSLHVYAVDHTWDPADELGCRWDDPDLAIPWDGDVELISPRDAALGTLADLHAELAAAAAAA